VHLGVGINDTPFVGIVFGASMCRIPMDEWCFFLSLLVVIFARRKDPSSSGLACSRCYFISWADILLCHGLENMV